MKKIIIIGAGISGLSAGIYAQKSGFSTVIFEKHYRPGGLCAAWKRDGYNIDGCVHWLTGTTPNTDLYQIWNDLGVIKNLNEDILFQKDAGVIHYKNETLTLYTDINKLQNELLRVGPEDDKEIKKFLRYLELTVNLPLPVSEPTNMMSFWRLMKSGISLIPYLPFYFWSSNTTCEKYAQRFKSPIIRYMITTWQSGPGCLYAFLYSLATIVYKNGGIPSRGSQGMVDSIVDTYQKLGGTIRYRTSVKEIIRKEGKAIGILLDNGETVYADYVIAAVDSYQLLHNLLNEEYFDKQFEKRLKDFKSYPSPSCFMAYFSINKQLLQNVMGSDVSFFPITKMFNVAGSDIDHFYMKSFASDSYFDKDNDTVFEILIDQYNINFGFWEELAKDKNEYNSYKNLIVSKIIEQLYLRYPLLRNSNLRVLDSYTPLTLHRYTNTYMGGYMSYMMTPNSPVLFHHGTIKGLTNLYVASQWSMSPGGLPLAAVSGKYAVQRILKREKMKHIFWKAFRFKHSNR